MTIVGVPSLKTSIALLKAGEQYSGKLCPYTKEEYDVLCKLTPKEQKAVHLCKRIFKATITATLTHQQKNLFERTAT